MDRIVDATKNATLGDLNWKRGELVAFDNTYTDRRQPLMLTIPTKIEPTVPGSSKGKQLAFYPAGKDAETWTLHSRANILGLWEPRRNGPVITPSYEIMFCEGRDYLVGQAIAGADEIKEYLSHRQNMEPYAEFMNSLVTQRTMGGKLVELMGLGFLLDNQLRFEEEVSFQ